ncbi:hypothetical protein HY091_01765 [Candidatus Kaiserbacteria bacterium]|nr:hypothetical protein [Candidatus Kaiserbacteria bacterium]
MKNIYLKLSLLLIAAVFYFVGTFFANPLPYGLCRGADNVSWICQVDTGVNVGLPLLSIGEWLALVAAVLFFASETEFKRWLKFSYYFVPIAAALLVFVFPIPMPVGTELSREGAARLLGIIYSVVTLAIVLGGRFAPKRTG